MNESPLSPTKSARPSLLRSVTAAKENACVVIGMPSEKFPPPRFFSTRTRETEPEIRLYAVSIFPSPSTSPGTTAESLSSFSVVPASIVTGEPKVPSIFPGE
jgi:hypothetical protein